MIFYQTRTTEGICLLESAIVDAVINAYAEEQRHFVHQSVNNELRELGPSVENWSEAVARFIRGFILRNRGPLSIDVPAPLPRVRCIHVFILNLLLQLTLSQFASGARMSEHLVSEAQ
jgi:hypothetical protein